MLNTLRIFITNFFICSLVYLSGTLNVWAGSSSIDSLNVSQNILSGQKQILLLDLKGQELPIGSVSFQERDDGIRYQLHIEHNVFTDYFLSMKEMKCLEGPELWCHLPYPYVQPRKVSLDDLRWLSHDLLFMFKQKEAFGANFWNGIYYDLRIENGVIVGEAQAVDLNILASPPDDLNQPIMDDVERDEVDRDKRWLPDIIIR